MTATNESFKQRRTERQAEYSETRKHQTHNKRSASRKSRIPYPTSISIALGALLVLFALANINAFHAALGLAMTLKFGPIYTLGGLLTHYVFDAAFRIGLIIGIAWFLLLCKRRKNWLDWVAVGFATIAFFCGTEILLNEVHWVVSVLLWFAFQTFQYQGITDDSKGFTSVFCILSYVVEFSIQCAANPISTLSLPHFFQAMHMLTLEMTDIKWAMVFINIIVMMGVEWMTRLIIWVNGYGE